MTLGCRTRDEGCAIRRGGAQSGVGRILHLGLLILLAAGGAGCIEVEEAVRIGRDGTVDYTFDFGMPEFLVVALGETFGGQSPDSGALFLRDRPPAALVNGDSVWTSEYVRGDLRHFVSRRAMTSLERLVEEGSGPTRCRTGSPQCSRDMR